MNKKLLFLIFIFLLVIFSTIIWALVYLPQGLFFREEKFFDILEIKKGEGIHEIASKLAQTKIIKNPLVFEIYAVVKNKAKKIQSGVYVFYPFLNIPQILEKITTGETIEIKITIPEGWGLKEIEKKLIKKFPNQKFNLKSLKIKDFKKEFDFLNDAPDENNLEGFLFPDTYFFSPLNDEKEIIKKFLKNFDKKLTANLREEIKKQNKNIFEIVKMASLLEKEVKTIKDKKIVSGILYKRLEENMPLQVDATIGYVMEKNKLSLADLKIDSPYNTYKYKGLPPGPISNPGLDSILAAIFPVASDYLYYLSAPDGTTIFSKTLDEHNFNKNKYLRQ